MKAYLAALNRMLAAEPASRKAAERREGERDARDERPETRVEEESVQ